MSSKVKDVKTAVRRFKKYPAYKDSDVDWLGPVPSHWELRRLRATVTACQNGVWGEDPDGIRDTVCVRVADFDRTGLCVDLTDPTTRSIDPSVVTAKRLRSGDLLLEKSGGGENQPVGAVVLYDHDMVAVSSNFVARMPVATGFSPRYLTYLHAALYAARVNTRSIKQSTGIQNLDSESYLNESVALPELREQLAIAAFLDRETARIDALVARKTRLVDLLNERRAALVSRAVTKGIDRGVSMRASSIDWLGEIPSHWQVMRMREIAKPISGATPPPDLTYWDGGIPWVSAKDMKRRFIDSSEDTVSPEAVALGLKLIPSPAVLIVVRGMILAHTLPVAVTRVAVTINQDMKALILHPNCCADFLAYSLIGLNEQILAVLVEEAAHGTKVIRMDRWRALPALIPPMVEQVAIAKFLDRETEKLDRLLAHVRAAIERLKQLRTGLVTSAVTGRIDVREEGAA